MLRTPAAMIAAALTATLIGHATNSEIATIGVALFVFLILTPRG